MRLKPQLISGALLAAMSALFISDVAVAGNGKAHMHKPVEFVKPGAAVSLTHDYGGQTALGEIEHFTATLEHIYEGGYLTAQVIAKSGLDFILDTAPAQSRLKPGSVISLPIQFSSMQAGEYFIGVEIVYESEAGEQSRRVLSVPVIIGLKPTEKSRPQSKAAPLNAAEGLIIMSAQEEIK